MGTHVVQRWRGSERSVTRDATAAAAVAFETELGWMALAFQDNELQGIVFGHDAQRNAKVALGRVLDAAATVVDFVDAADCPATIRDLIDRLERYAAGERVDFRDVAVGVNHLTPFGRKVVAACRRIPTGQTRSYGQLAAVCGAAGAARAVGRVMAKNRYPIVVPCHRVVGANGSLGGFSAPQGLVMKRRMLSLEADASPLPI